METKSQQLQIRVTPSEKAALKSRARAAGQDVSTYVLARVLPSDGLRFQQLLRELEDGRDRPYVLAELNDFLSSLCGGRLSDALTDAEVGKLPPLERNYVAAMVEHAAAAKGVRPPEWVAAVPPLQEPWFATPLRSLRLHLLRAAPVAFKRRNLFVDATIGDRV